MRIDIRARGFALTEGLRAHAERRLRFALARFEDRVARVAVRLSDLNGPRGGVDKRCLLRLRARGLAEIVIDEAGADLYAAISRAAERAGRMLGRGLARSRGISGARNDGEVNG